MNRESRVSPSLHYKHNCSDFTTLYLASFRNRCYEKSNYLNFCIRLRELLLIIRLSKTSTTLKMRNNHPIVDYRCNSVEILHLLQNFKKFFVLLNTAENVKINGGICSNQNKTAEKYLTDYKNHGNLNNCIKIRSIYYTLDVIQCII